MAQTEVKLDGCTSLDEALARIRGAPLRSVALAARLRLARRRLVAAPAPTRRSRRDHRRRPTAMIAKDYHSIWLNSAGLVFAGGDLDVDGGVVERDASGEPTGILREEAAWRFKERHMIVPEDDYVTRCGRGQARERAWRHGRARQGRLARRSAAVAAARRARPAVAPRLAVDAVRQARARSRDPACVPALEAPYLQARLSQGVHGRDARLPRRRGCSTAPVSRSPAGSSWPRS